MTWWKPEKDNADARRASYFTYARFKLMKHDAGRHVSSSMYSRGWAMTLFQDVRYGIRVLLKSPGFLIVAVLSLALGIGANATIFTMINSVFLQPLPVEKPSELMYVYGTDSSNAQNAVLGKYMPVSYPNYVDYKTQNDVFAELGVYGFPNAVSMAGGE